LAALGQAFETASPALMRVFCENLKRQIVIGPKLKSDMSKGAVIERLVVSVHPHPDQGLPRLWSLKDKDDAVRLMPWPLPLAKDIKDMPEPAAAASISDNVFSLGRRA
jgi:hypothetical protein